MITVLRHSLTPRIVATLVLEFAAALTFLVGAPLVDGMQSQPVFEGSAVSPLFVTMFALFNIAVIQFCFWSFGLYSREMVYSGARIPAGIGGALIFAAILMVPFHAVFSLVEHPFLDIPLYKFSAFFLAFAAFLVIERFVLLRMFADRSFLGNVLILGTGPATTEIIKEVHRRHRDSLRIAGVLTAHALEVGGEIRGCKVLGSLNEVRDHVDYSKAGSIVIALPSHTPDLPTEFLVKCKFSGIRVIDAGEFYESIAKKVLLEHFSPREFLYRRNLLMTRFRWWTKLVFEKSTALLILLAALPVILLAALIVRLTSRGPVLFRQTRVGQGGEPFTLVKFRSMVANAERGEAVWAVADDPRVTTFGKLMRKTRIDELPQLMNILRGDMSIVGPRPERPEFVAQLSEAIPHYANRHLVKPGLTGWAQVAFRYGASIEDSAEKLRYDLYYVKHMSLGFDLIIILNTIRIVLFQSGAR